MNNIIKYNTIILNYIILFVLIVLVLFLGYKLWNRYVGKSINFQINLFKNKNKEDFSQVSLEKQTRLYDDYRNYVEGKNLLERRCLGDKRMLPYIVSPSCFSDKYVKCMKEKVVDKDDNNLLKNSKNFKNNEEIFIHSDLELDGFNNELNNKYLDVDYYKLKHSEQYNNGFEVSSKQCQDMSYDMCLTDNFRFI